ncbi:MAG: monofunctional biosynthetic peptidoglycan transglycosylase [Pseudomonadota bacterium]
MAGRAKSTGKKTRRKAPAKPSVKWRLLRWSLRGISLVFLVALFLVVLFAVFNPPTNPYIFSESRRLGGVKQEWVPMENIAPVMARSAVAAEDANFCTHWGFDMAAIRAALAEGGGRGASTISQQTVKNVYLWQGRSWVRKALEALATPLVEAVWSKRRIIEVYLNVAEFDEGVFGVQAAAQHYFGVDAADLSATQAARLAAILPSPKKRSASNPSSFVRQRTRQIRDGAATISKDGRASCFES